MAKPEHKPTKETRAQVESLISCGVTQDEICKFLQITDKTLQKYYRYEIDTAVTRANAQVASSLFRKATKSNDVTAQIFWLKTRARWRTNELENLIDQNEHLREELKTLRAELDAKNKKEY